MRLKGSSSVLRLAIRATLGFVLVLSSIITAVARPNATAPDPEIQGILDQVNSTALSNYVGSLSGEWPVEIGGSLYTLATRYSRTTEPIQKAAQYAYEHFQSLGLAVQYFEYTLNWSGLRQEVIAEQPGLTDPGCIYMIVAHLDDYSEDPEYQAPGADDNASGSSGVLLAADLLKHHFFACTLRYALFTGEEQGLIGSIAYADYVRSQNEDIRGVLNLDMIGYNSKGKPEPVLDLHTRSAPSINAGDLAIAYTFIDVVDAYHLNLAPDLLQDDMRSSDHVVFWDRGYPAILAIEDEDDFTPNYHKTSDTLSTLNLAYFTDIVKAALGTIAHLAGLLPQGHLSGLVSDLTSGNPIPDAAIEAKLDPSLIWSSNTDSDGSYDLTLPAGIYQVTASAPWYTTFTVDQTPVAAGQTTLLNISLAGCTPSQVDFTFSPPEPWALEPVTFTSALTTLAKKPPAANPAAAVYRWDFGDGTPPLSGEGLSVVSHSFPMAPFLHIYTVNLAVEDGCTPAAGVTYPVIVQTRQAYLPIIR
jgi:hypothetical protein